MAKLRNILLLLLVALSVQAEISFRGAWIATVANIDWPSKEAVGNADKQQEGYKGLHSQPGEERSSG